MTAGIRALLRRPLAYAVTAKGSLQSADSVRTFRLHILWAAIAGTMLAVSFRLHHDFTALRAWASLAVVAGTGPPLMALISRLSRGSGSGRPRPAWVPYNPNWVPYDMAAALYPPSRRRLSPAASGRHSKAKQRLRPAKPEHPDRSYADLPHSCQPAERR